MINSSLPVVFLYIAALPVIAIFVCLIAHCAATALSLRCNRHDFVVRALLIWFLMWNIGSHCVTRSSTDNQFLVLVAALVSISIALNTAVGWYLSSKTTKPRQNSACHRSSRGLSETAQVGRLNEADKV